MNKTQTLTPRLVFKLWLALSLLIVGMGVCYILITNYFSNQHHLATQQEINAPLAQHLIDEKFLEEQPFLDDGSINKELFSGLMHDMMAINRSIEVYLLDNNGKILHSVVLDPKPGDPAQYVDIVPITNFLAKQGKGFYLGEDPRDREERKIFSAAQYDTQGKTGFVYIILSGEAYQLASSNIFNKYIKSFGLGAIALTTGFTLLIGFVLIWFITKNLRTITQVAMRFKDGDLKARILYPEKTDVAVFANTFNQMADTITSNLEDIKSVDDLRRQLIANVSHDLRTPLAILKGYAETLMDKSSTLTIEETTRYLSIINSNSDRLSKLVEQLFEYSKLEAKQIEPLKEQFSITDLCLDLVSKFDILAKEKNIELSFSVKNNKNILVFADISLIERAIQNLLDNALKFTTEGGAIKIELEKRNEFCYIIVNDSGIGIEEDLQHLIFERFKQTSGAYTKQGAGLGLAIVKKIIELHDGMISVHSKKNVGSTFTINIPI